MRRLKGTVVSEGVGRGEALVVATGEVFVPEGRVAAHLTDREVQRFDRALGMTRKDIEVLKDEARSQLGEMTEIIDTYLAFLGDERSLLGPIRALIREQHFTATYATFVRFRDVAQDLERMPEPLPSRVPDLLDIKRRLITHLRGGREHFGELQRLRRKVVIIADDLTPTQTATLDREKVLAIATDRGGPASHTAILARHLGIPAIVGLGSATHSVRSGDTVIVDALSGHLIVNPDQDTTRHYQALGRRFSVVRRKVDLESERAETRDGVPVTILGNIDDGEQAAALRELGVQGVGLFRTEFLFLGGKSPGEETQYQHYKNLLEVMHPHPVSIRTMDFGADKWDHRVGGQVEPNPFLGMRAIRLSFAHEGLFRTQLRAILRASPVGNCRVMFPMITDLGEFRRAQAILQEVWEELRNENLPVSPSLMVGSMVETPSAALTAATLLRESAFVSLGTNDLTQYTLAVDRTNPLVASLFIPFHPSVLRLIRMTVQAAGDAGKPISACGEMAGTSACTPILLGLGLRHLSMAARRVPDVVTQIRRVRIDDCQQLVETMLAADDGAHAQRLLDQFHSTRRRS